MTRAFAAIVAIAASGCNANLPPYAEVDVVVATDLPVPFLAARLRVDLYEDGLWFESRDVARHDPRDWPVKRSRIRLTPEGDTPA